MRLPVEWIREYAPIEADADEVAARLTMAGLEVEETAESAQGAVLDIKVTPNRGDCLSVVGVARELAASYGVALAPRPPLREAGEGEAASLPTSVEIEAPDLCPRYAARLVRNIRDVPSPPWMQARLEAAGMRPINGLVDVTNYVMLETGQPLHAFDYDTLAERRIVVRRACPGETMTTLDGVERAFTPEMLVIADAEKPVAIAGVMGGADTEMSDRTTTMLLESAHFDARSIRRTSRVLGLRTEASYRFERVVDPEGVVAAADRACDLIAKLGMGEVMPGVVDVYPGAAAPRVLTVRPERISLLLGFDVTPQQVTESLTRLGFQESQVADRNSQGETKDGGRSDTLPSTLNPRPSTLSFVVPSWRPDIVREDDIAEEVGRVVGYENIPEKLPVGVSLPGRDSEEWRFGERIRSILVGAGLQEIVAHSLLKPTPYEDPRDAEQRIGIRSALSEELSGLRRSLLPGLIEAMERNARRGMGPLAFFEVGHVFCRTDAGFCEKPWVAAALAGPVTPSSWEREPRAPADFYTMRGLVERIVGDLHIAGLRFERSDDSRLHPGRAARVLVGEEEIGFAGELHPELAATLTVRDRIVTFALDLARLWKMAAGAGRFATLSPFPAVTRDLAPRIAADVPYRRVEEAVAGAGVALVERYDLTDVFTGPPLPEGVKSLTLSFTFRAPDRTLTEAEVGDALARLRAALEARCGATFPS